MSDAAELSPVTCRQISGSDRICARIEIVRKRLACYSTLCSKFDTGWKRRQTSLGASFDRRIVVWPLALVISMLCAGSVAVGQEAKLLPVDEASNDPSFFVFRMRLIEAAANRDTTFVIRHLAPDVKSNFGGDVGAADFRRFWRIGNSDSPLWGILAKVLGGGGVLWEDGLGGNGFEAPYWTAVWDVDTYNPFDYGVFLSENEPVYARPDLESVVVDSASFEIVRIANPYVLSAAGDDRQWSEVELGSGSVGYVPSSVIGSPVDHRMMFRKVGGRWTILWLLAGD